MVLTEHQYKDLREALSILHDYLRYDDSDEYPKGVKESYWKSHAKAEDVLRDYENNQK